MISISNMVSAPCHPANTAPETAHRRPSGERPLCSCDPDTNRFAFFPLARRIERRDAGSGRPDAPTADPRGTETRVPAAAVATLVAVAGPLAYYLGSVVPQREPPSPELTASTEWRRETAETFVRPTGWLPAFGGAVEHLTGTWSDGARLLLTDRLVYRGQSQGAELIGYDNRIAPDTALVAERLMGPVGPRRRLVNEAIVREGDDDYRLVWYWYRVAGVETESAARAKLLELWAFATVSRVSELVAVSTPCDGDSCVQASDALSGFLGGT
jgi:EpsI family protein